MTERFNRTLLNMLGTLENSEKQNWKKYIPSLVHAYNCTRHESTGYSPFELMFGRKPRLPIDAAFGLENSDENLKNYNEYILDLQNTMEKTFDIVQKATEKSRTKQKVQCDKKAKANKLHVGDHVLQRILAFDGKHKIADKFEEIVYVIKSQPNQDIPVFVILDKDGRQKTVHRNLIIPTGTIEQLKRTEVRPDTEEERKQEEEEQKDENVRLRERDANDSEEHMYIIKVLAPQSNTDIIHQPEEQDKVPVVREIEKNIEPDRRSTREKRRPVWHDSYAMSQREVTAENERVRLITQLISSDVFKVTPP